MVMLCNSLPSNDLQIFTSVNNHWWAEIKQDGVRATLNFKGGVYRLKNRRGTDITKQFPEITNLQLTHDCILDGELVVFQQSKAIFQEGIKKRVHCTNPSSINSSADKFPATFVAFDIIELNNNPLINLPLIKRRELLKKTVKETKQLIITKKYSSPVLLWEEIKKNDLEGLVLKNPLSLYVNKRSSDWLKVKNLQEVDESFNSYEVNNQGIRLTNNQGLAVQVNGYQSQLAVKELLLYGSLIAKINHLGFTSSGKLRQPVVKEIIVTEEQTNGKK